ncbi:NLI interacting factor family phosphatase [Cardiosporidium cionae]|uniref:protein-serine/threonine phosphatase n=1 Tax=Cardiosporidium cionae TaxID=476202 RepID=A0ABQ7J6Q2_9APIC|nr:NLI interacting factor family phosphatase [Cardiosporidium cionae]|eukprot:KAF8819645.1 NLI interacting factor family phosphatase [Cardiosporidium cionae]
MTHSHIRPYNGRNTNTNFYPGMRETIGRGRYGRRPPGVAPLSSKVMNVNIPPHVTLQTTASGRSRSRSPMDNRRSEMIMSNCIHVNPMGVYNYIKGEPANYYASSRNAHRFNVTGEEFAMRNTTFQKSGEIRSKHHDVPQFCSPSSRSNGQTVDLFNQGLNFYNPALLNAEGNEFCRSRVLAWYNYLLRSPSGVQLSQPVNVKVESPPLLNPIVSTMAQNCNNIILPSIIVPVSSDIVDVDQMSEVSDDSDVDSLLGLPIIESTVPAIYEPEEGELMEIEQVGGSTFESSSLAGNISNSIATNITFLNSKNEACSIPSSSSGSELSTAPPFNLPFVSPSLSTSDTVNSTNFSMSNGNFSSNCTLSTFPAYSQAVTPSSMRMAEMLNLFPQYGALVPQNTGNQCVGASVVNSDASTTSFLPSPSKAPVNMSPTTARLKSEKRLVLVLDLDNTLLQSYPRSKLNCEIDLGDFLDRTNEPELYKFVLALMPEYFYYLKLRPFVRQFLAALQPYYEFSVYTNATCDYADIVLSILDPDRTYFGDRVAARKERNNIDEPKSIKRLYPDVDVRYVLAFDDRTDVWVDLDRKQVLKAEHYQFLIQNQTKLLESYPVNGGDVSSNFFIPQRVCDYDQHLHFMTSVFMDVHKKFFESPDSFDIGNILEQRKLNVLKGVGIFFTGFLKEGVKGEGFVGAESERMHKDLAKEFGATVHAQFDDPAVTHVVALRSTTENYKKCRELTGSTLKRVHSWWLYDCIGTWEKREEACFDADILCVKTRQNKPACSFQEHWACRWDGAVPQRSTANKSKTSDELLPSRNFLGTGDYSNSSVVVSPFERILIHWSPGSQTLGQAKDLATATKNTSSIIATRGPLVENIVSIGNHSSTLENYSNPVDVLTTVESLSAMDLKKFHGNGSSSLNLISTSANFSAWDDKNRQNVWNAGRNLDTIPVSTSFQSKWKVDESGSSLKSSSHNLNFLSSPSTTTSISAAI